MEGAVLLGGIRRHWIGHMNDDGSLVAVGNSRPLSDVRDLATGMPLPRATLGHAARVCYLIGDAAATRTADRRVRLHHQVNGNFNALCPDQRWWRQPVVLERSGEAFGSFGYTGYLVAPDLVLTCWHGWDHFQHARQVAVFDYAIGPGNDVPVELSAESVIEVAPAPVWGPDEALAAALCAGDWVLLRLERPVARALEPVQVAAPRPGAMAYVLGHPLGLPLKLAQGGRVLGVEGATFRVALDTYTGNSGSPVFDADSHALIGIVSEGPPGVGDFTPQADQQCYSYRSAKGSGSGTLCVSASCFAPRLPMRSPLP
jgi:hypothetical protein